MVRETKETPVEPGFPSVQEMVEGGVQRALRDGAYELVRASGQRGIVYLQVELCLGDRGEPMWMTHSLHFVPKLHQKDARETTDGKA